MGHWSRTFAAAAIGCAVALSACGGSSTATSPPAAGGTVAGDTAALVFGCNWLFESDAQTANIEYPETHAVYWVAALPNDIPSGDLIEIAGQSADSRYFSFEIYSEDGTLESGLNDTQVVASQAPTFELVPAGQGYKVSVIYRIASSSSGTTLGANPANLSTRAPAHKFLLYRLYLPGSGSADFQNLPTLTYVARNGVRTPLSATPDLSSCKSIHANIQNALVSSSDVGSGSSSSVADLSNPIPAIKPSNMMIYRSGLGQFENMSAQYMYEKNNTGLGDMLLLRGKAPIFAGSGPQPQVRYWSICSAEFHAPHRVAARLADQEASLDAAGYYNIVISLEPPPAGYQLEFDYLPWGNDAFGSPIYRQLLASPAFSQSIANSDASPDPSLSEGVYFPQATYCSKQVFFANLNSGAAAVFEACKSSQGLGLVPDLD